MQIRRAITKDIPRLIDILQQVLEIHAQIRSDIFISGTTKYTKEQLEELLKKDGLYIDVAVDDNDMVMGYCFAFVQAQPFITNMHQFTKLYIDDLGVDEKYRHQGIGKALFENAKKRAQELGCYEITLNVWEGNDSAKAFYKSIGMQVKESNMEFILK